MNKRIFVKIIGIDCRDLQVASSGTKTYLAEIIKALQETKESPNVRIVLIKPFLPVISGKSFLAKGLKHIQFFCWKQISLPILAMLKNCDVLICTDYFAPCITPLKYRCRLSASKPPVQSDYLLQRRSNTSPSPFQRSWLTQASCPALRPLFWSYALPSACPNQRAADFCCLRPSWNPCS